MSLELSILKSMAEYPAQIEEFCTKLPQKIFSKNALVILSKLIELGKSANLTSLEASLSEEYKNSDFYIDFLNSPVDVNYMDLKPLFLRDWELKNQQALAQKILKATAQGELIDIDVLRKEYDSSQMEFKTLREWGEHFDTLPPSNKYKTHISFLDSCFNNGFEGGQLVLISGDPEAGKTMLGTQILENIAKSQKVAFFCFEFTIQSYIKSRQGMQIYKDNIIVINEGYNINEIAHNIKELYKQGVNVFLIDSQMRITSPNGRNMEEEESLKFSTLARLCHSLGIIVFLIVQTSKGDRDNPMGSKKGGHEASIILRIEHCKAKDENLREFDEDTRMFIVKKNKQTGKHFKEKVRFKDLRFSSMEREVDESAISLDIDEITSILNF